MVMMLEEEEKYKEEKKKRNTKGPGVLKNEDTGNQADYEEAEAVLQSIKESSTERHEGAGLTGRWIGWASRALKEKAQKGKDGYTRLCN